MPSDSRPESAILADIRAALGRRSDLRIWRNNTGRLRDDTGRLVQFGLAKGSSDLIGILAPSGRMFALEVKNDRGHATDEQIWFIEIIRRFGGFGAFVRSVEDAEKAIVRAKMGESE